MLAQGLPLGVDNNMPYRITNITFESKVKVLFDLILYVSVNNFSVMSGRVFLGWTSTKQR